MKTLLDWFKASYQRKHGEPVWTLGHDGEVRKARLKRCPDGSLLLSKICGWVLLNADGTLPSESYIVKYWPR